MARQTYRNTIMPGMEKEEQKGGREGILPFDQRKSVLQRAAPISSLFATVVNPEMKRSNLLRGAPQEDMLDLFEDVKAQWETTLKLMIKRGQSRSVIMKESFRPDMTVCHQQICGVFEELVHKFELDPDQELFNKKTFSDELIQTAILGIEHSYHCLEKEIFNAVINVQRLPDDIIHSLFFSIVTFNEFFFLLGKFNCTVLLQEKHLLFLMKVVSEVLSTLQLKLQDCIKILDDSPDIETKQRTVAQYIYYSLQTLAALAICEEKPALSKKKYILILEKFDSIFSMLTKSLVCQIIFNIFIEFEKGWSREGPCKYILTSFNQKRLSLYLMEYGPSEPLTINLNYVVVSYYNNILKLIAKRSKIPLQLNSTNFLTVLLKSNRDYIHLISTKKSNQKEKMLILNLNLKIVRTLFLHLEFSFDKLTKLQISTNHELIKQTITDSLFLAIEEGFVVQVAPKAKSQLDYLNITAPIDFFSLTFKTLIRFKTLYSFTSKPAVKIEALHYLNLLIIHLLSIKLLSLSKFNILLYKLYLLQFINIFSDEELKEQYAKYIEEIYDILHMKDEPDEDDTLQYLRNSVREKSLDLYIKLARIDCRPAIEVTLTSINETTMSFNNLLNLFYILSCVLSRIRIDYSEFSKLGKGEHGVLARIFGQLPNHLESQIFVELGGMNKLLSIYLPALDEFLKQKNNLIKPDSECDQSKRVLDLIGTFFSELHFIKEVTEYTLYFPLLNVDFIERFLKNSESLVILLHVLNNMQQNATSNSELIECYVSVLVNALANVNTQLLDLEGEKKLLQGITHLIESLTSDSKGKMSIVAKEILFRKAVLQMYLDIIQSPQYFSESKFFLQFLELLKCVIKGNYKFEASSEWKENTGKRIQKQFRHLYSLAREQEPKSSVENSDKFQVEKVFDILLEIAFQNDVSTNRDKSLILKEAFAIECFYQSLYYCLKYPLGEDKEILMKYLLLPSEAGSQSIFNISVCARTKVPIILMKLLPHLKNSELQKQVSSFIGVLGSIHSTREQMSFILKMMRGKSHSLSWKEESQLFQILVETLVDIISGDSISSFFYFSGSEKSYIKLQPSNFPSKNFIWVGNIRLEKNSRNSRQCIYSFLREKPGEIRGVELYVEKYKLVYQLVKIGKTDSSQKIILEETQLRDNKWHNISLAHLGNKLIVFLDEHECSKECFSISSLPGGYTTATIGASLCSEIDKCNFFGEMSCLYFFNAGQKAESVLRDIAFHTSLLPLLFLKAEAIASNPNYYPQFLQMSGLQFYSPEFQFTTAFIVDPRFHAINENIRESCLMVEGRNMNCVESLMETKKFLNRSGNEVFANIGGFRTCFMLLCSRMHSTPEDSFFCTGIFRMLYALCLNNDAATIDYCMSSQGISMIKHVLQCVALVSPYSSEFVELFNIFELAGITGSKQLKMLVPKLIENVVFNLGIWTTSEYEVQRRLMERIENYFERTTSIQFSQGQPYKSMLNTLYDYFSPETFQEKSVKEALEDIRTRLLKMVLTCINRWGTARDVKTISHFLDFDIDKFYSIRDLLSVILTYSSQEEFFDLRKPDQGSIFEKYVRNCYTMKELDCDFLLCLFKLKKEAIIYKDKLLTKIKNGEAISIEQIDCCEEVIVYSLQILLSLNWEEIFSDKVKKGSPKKKKVRLFQFLKPKRKYINQVQTEDVIINILFKNYLSEEEIGTFRILGYPTFLALIGQIFTQPSFWINHNSNIYKRILNMQEADICNSRFKLFFQETFLNLNSFQLEVQEAMLRDILGFFHNPLFLSNFINLSKVLDVLIDSLSDTDYFMNSTLKELLLEVVLLFLIHYWKDRLKRDIMQKVFSRLGDFTSEVLIDLADKIITYFLKDPVRSVNEESMFNTTQLVYLFEDVALYSESMLNSIAFLKFMGKLTVYLSEVKLLYFWHPAILSQAGIRDMTEMSRALQREGGMARVVLKLIMGILLYMEEDWEEENKQLAFTILKYFLRHKHKDLEKICLSLKISGIPSLKEETATGDDDGFLGKKIETFNVQENLQTHLRAIKLESKSPTVRFEESKISLSNPYESQYFRLSHVLTQLCQIYIYNSFGIYQYRTLIEDKTKFEYIKQKICNKTNCQFLEELIAKLTKYAEIITKSNFREMLTELHSTSPHFCLPTVSGKYSPVDFIHLSSAESEKIRRIFCTHMSLQTIFFRAPESVPGISPTSSPRKKGSKPDKSENRKINIDENSNFFKTISSLYNDFKNKKVSASDFSTQFQLVLLQYKFIKYGLSFLHLISTEDYLYIDINIFMHLCSREKSKRGRFRSEIGIEMEKDVRERIIGVENSIKEYFAIEEDRPSETINLKQNNEEFKVELYDMEKLLLSDEILSPTPKINIKCYEICSLYYSKLLKRCLLNHQEAKKEKPSITNQFMKCEMTTDNLGRYMRMKPIKAPLKNHSVLKGVRYVKHYLLKKILLLRILKRTNISNIFLFPTKYHKILLHALMNAKISSKKKKKRPSDIQTRSSLKRTSLISRTQELISNSVVNDNPFSSAQKHFFKAEWVKIDYSIFGHIEFNTFGISFSSEQKDRTSDSYHLGPSSEITKDLDQIKTKNWRHTNIKKIIMRRYHLIHQAVEIFLTNHKSVFLVLFSEENLALFFKNVRTRYRNVEIIEDPISEFRQRKFTEEWRKGKLTNFEYLMTLNNFGGRSCQDLSQYYIFPWVIANYREKEFSFEKTAFREFENTIAGLTKKKMEEADLKYENTEDFPEGRFQFGTHYMPGRVVLAYLMRIQPYTEMIEQFDSGGDTPARHFHFLQTLWSNICTESDTNYELIPEYFYNPEIFINRNKFSFGTKSIEDRANVPRGQIVRVNNVVLPAWARDNHHFIFLNSLSLEHKRVRRGLPHWIDLIFGVDQQNPDRYNMFKPLTSEKKIKEMNLRRELTRGDLNHVAEFGHNPIQLFTKTHKAYEEKSMDVCVFDAMHPLLSPTMSKISIEKSGDRSLIIRLIPTKEKQCFIFLHSSGLYTRKQFSKGKAQNVGKVGRVPSSFSFFDTSQTKFLSDPDSAVTGYGDYLVTCRDIDNLFIVHHVGLSSPLEFIAFHKNIVTSVHMGANNTLYTGDMDGVVAEWNFNKLIKLKELLKSPTFYMCEHAEPIVSLTSEYALDMYVSAGSSSLVLRVSSSHRFFRRIIPTFDKKYQFHIYKVLLSLRGYLVVLSKRDFLSSNQDDLMVYSINGEKIAEILLEEYVNAMILDQTQYFLIVAGTSRTLKQYCLVTLQAEDLMQASGLSLLPAAVVSLSFVNDFSGFLVGLGSNQFFILSASLPHGVPS